MTHHRPHSQRADMAKYIPVHVTAQAELNKSAVMQDKLQTLCRELQKQNKQVVDDSKQAVLQEHERRQEMSNKFGETVKVLSIAAVQALSTCESQRATQTHAVIHRASLLDWMSTQLSGRSL